MNDATSTSETMDYNSNNNNNVIIKDDDKQVLQQDLEVGRGINNNANNNNDDYSSTDKEQEEVVYVIQQSYTIRIIISIIGILISIGIIVLLVFTIQNDETNNFDKHYEQISNTIIQTIQYNANIKFNSLHALSIELTAYAAATVNNNNNNNTWPYVTVNEFTKRTESILELINGHFIQLIPIIQTEIDKIQWEEYSINNYPKWINIDNTNTNNEEEDNIQKVRKQRRINEDGFILDSTNLFQSYYETNNSNNNEETLVITSSTDDTSTTNEIINTQHVSFLNKDSIAEEIYMVVNDTNAIPDPGPPYYAPLWQSAPLYEYNMVNYNFLRYNDHEAYSLRTAYEKSRIVMSTISEIYSDTNEIDFTALFLATTSTQDNNNKKKQEKDQIDSSQQQQLWLTSNIFYPIFQDTSNTDTVVAVLLAAINWNDDSWFPTSITQDDGAIDVVVENTCNTTYTFRIDDSGTHIVGFGDQHETKYNSYKRSWTLDNIENIDDLRIDPDVCIYTFNIYPTSELEDEYNDNYLTILVAASVGALVLVLVILFYAYSKFQPRQYTIHYDPEDSEVAKLINTKSYSNGGINENNKDRYTETATTLSSVNSVVAKQDAPPLFDPSHTPTKYYNTTVLFIDICGFDTWSSKRSASETFAFLEAIYEGFDELAKKYSVFKVEANGDSYAAVVGLPIEQPNHALMMARFALQCQRKMVDMLQKLQICFGKDTSKMGLQMGMHSGPVDAVVHRGGGSVRFRLYGNTVRVAAIMEKTSKRDKVQMTNVTARLLEVSGKPNWVEPRNDDSSDIDDESFGSFWLVRPNKFDFILPKEMDNNLNTSSSSDSGSSMHEPSHLVKTVVERLLPLALPNSRSTQGGNVGERIEQKIATKLQKLILKIERAYIGLRLENDDEDIDKLIFGDGEKPVDLESNAEEDTPTTSLANIFFALIHDATLTKNVVASTGTESKRRISKKKSNKMTLDTFWDIFMSKRFRKIRDLFFTHPSELTKFYEEINSIFSAHPSLNQMVPDSQSSDETSQVSNQRIKKSGHGLDYYGHQDYETDSSQSYTDTSLDDSFNAADVSIDGMKSLLDNDSQQALEGDLLDALENDLTFSANQVVDNLEESDKNSKQGVIHDELKSDDELNESQPLLDSIEQANEHEQKQLEIDNKTEETHTGEAEEAVGILSNIESIDDRSTGESTDDQPNQPETSVHEIEVACVESEKEQTKEEHTKIGEEIEDTMDNTSFSDSMEDPAETSNDIVPPAPSPDVENLTGNSSQKLEKNVIGTSGQSDDILETTEETTQPYNDLLFLEDIEQEKSKELLSSKSKESTKSKKLSEGVMNDSLQKSPRSQNSSSDKKKRKHVNGKKSPKHPSTKNDKSTLLKEVIEVMQQTENDEKLPLVDDDNARLAI